MLTHERLSELLSYDATTGTFRWLVRSGRSAIGTVAGARCGNYLAIQIDGERYYSHRLAWFWQTGAWPVECIDHIDGNGSNNEITNLREATHQENSRNQRHRRGARNLLKGINYHRQSGKWTAHINVGGKVLSLKYHDTPEAAHAAYVVAAKEHFGEFARVA